MRQLRASGFGGVVVIHSANDELDDEREYAAAGADTSFGKAVQGGVEGTLAVLGRAWHKNSAGVPPGLQLEAGRTASRARRPRTEHCPQRYVCIDSAESSKSADRIGTASAAPTQIGVKEGVT